MLGPDQLEEFERRGLLALPGAFARDGVDAVADRVWAHLARHRGIHRDDPTTWGVPAPWAGLKELRQDPPYTDLHSPVVEAALDDLLGAGAWRRPRSWGGFLVSFPDCTREGWRIPTAGWHVDFHYTHPPGTPFGARVLVFLADVPALGGGTLVVPGSHTLMERYVAGLSAAARRRGYAVLREEFNASLPWLCGLTAGDREDPERTARYLAGAEVDGVDVRVEAVSGRAGDAVLTHPWLLHATGPNAGPRPRFMLGQTIYAASPALAAGV